VGKVDERILDAAGKLFLERCFSGASVDEIAEAAGAGKPTIYAKSPGTDALFAAVIERLVRRNTSLSWPSSPNPAQPGRCRRWPRIADPRRRAGSSIWRCS
jgi:AcrR family transcriptional regulator